MEATKPGITHEKFPERRVPQSFQSPENIRFTMRQNNSFNRKEWPSGDKVMAPTEFKNGDKMTTSTEKNSRED